jgi:hypothetical protein
VRRDDVVSARFLRRIFHAVVLTFALGASSAATLRTPDDSPFAPASVRTLASFGATGDGAVDDTVALKAALAQSNRYCLDGQRRVYKVSGTLAVSGNLCLKNATLRQAAQPFDTTRYVSRRCNGKVSPFTASDCGDPEIDRKDVDALHSFLSVRTLLIRPDSPAERIRVHFDHVTIDRGPHPEAGSRQDSAGIWIENGARVDLNEVEITGGGKGFGLLIASSQHITIRNLNVHDLVWAPYKGDRPLIRSDVERIGWNGVPIHEFRAPGQDGATSGKFYETRVQEQITGVMIVRSRHVLIDGGRISHCGALFDTGFLPWQADGLDFGGSSGDIVVRNIAVDSTWEGIDVVANGEGIDGLVLDRPIVRNSFGFGIKLGYSLSRATLVNPIVRGAGLAGIILYGPVKDARITGATISGLGSIALGAARFDPWPNSMRAGLRLDAGSPGTESQGRLPDGVRIENGRVSAGPGDPPFAYGFLNMGASNVVLSKSSAKGYIQAPERGF